MSRTLLKTKAVNFSKKYAYILAFLAIVGGSSAFKMAETMFLADEWYEYTPNAASPDPEDPNQYTPTGSATNPAGCSDGGPVCAVRVPDGGTLTRAYLESLNVESGIGNENIVFQPN